MPSQGGSPLVSHMSPPWKTSPSCNLCLRRGLTGGAHKRTTLVICYSRYS